MIHNKIFAIFENAQLPLCWLYLIFSKLIQFSTIGACIYCWVKDGCDILPVLGSIGLFMWLVYHDVRIVQIMQRLIKKKNKRGLVKKKPKFYKTY